MALVSGVENIWPEKYGTCRVSSLVMVSVYSEVGSGKIAGRGTHAELLTRRGIYAALWADQAGGFLVDEPVAAS